MQKKQTFAIDGGSDGMVLGIARRASLALMFAALPVIALNISTSAALAQASSSSDAAGSVTDASGAVIPGATVHLINNGTKAERVTTTNGAGEWSIPNVPPANYTVRVEKAGFRTSTISSLDVEIGHAANGSVTLQVGGANETIEVSTLPPQLQTQEATVGQVIDQKQINDLPLNGRSVLQLATLAPGVSPAQSGQTGNPGQFGTRNLYITVDGGRGSSTNYVLDGTYVRSVRFNNMSFQPNVDTLQEFNLLRSTFSTEYGQGQAVVSMVTKSGTNSIHGTGYEFARNAVFDARNYFNPTFNTINGVKVPNPKPDFYRHQFGGTVGFPIVKDKFFVFGGYEGQRSSRGVPLAALFPTQNELSGTWDTTSSVALPKPSGPLGIGYSKTNPAGFTLTSKAAIALNPTYPVLNSDALSILGTSNYFVNGNFIDNYDEYTVRADQTLSSRNSLFERYVNFNSIQKSPNAIGSIQLNPLLGRNAVLGDTFLITSHLVNESRIGWNEYYNFPLGTMAPNAAGVANWPAAEGLTFLTASTSKNQNGRAAFTIQGFNNAGDFPVFAGDQGDHQNIISAGDTLSDVIGRHTLKFGFQFQNRRLWQFADNNARGGATFNDCNSATYVAGYVPKGPDDDGGGNATSTPSGIPNTNVVSVNNCPFGSKSYQVSGQTFFYNRFQNYARGMCTSGCSGAFGTSLGHYRDNTYGAFFTDTWNLSRRITLNLGMRWEYNAPWVEQNGLEGSLDPVTGLVTFVKIPKVIPASLVPTIDFTRTYRPGIVPPQKKGFMPRVGVAFEARPGTVFRAGYGVYLDNLNTNELQFTRYAAPLYYQQSFTNVFTNTMYPDPTNAPAGALPAPFSVLPNNSRPITQEWNASVQQDLGHGMVLEMAYTGSNTHHLWKRVDENMYIQVPFQVPTSFVRKYTSFGQGVLTSTTQGSSSFNGASVKVEKRLSNGLFFLGSYTWSKNLDNSSGEASANDSSFALAPSFDRSYSNFDNRNRGVISGGYELPFGKGKAYLTGPIGTAVAGGWTFQPAIQLRTGYPFAVAGSGCANIGFALPCRAFLAPGRTVASSYRTSPSPFDWFDATAFSDSPTAATVTRTNGAYADQGRPIVGLQGWVTRNVGRGPGTASVDFSAIKNLKVRERFTVQFRAEAYNIINRAIFSNPGGSLGTLNTLGKVTSTSADNRSIQLGIKGMF